MGFKYQMMAATQPADLFQVSLNHLDVLAEIVLGSDVECLINNFRARFVDVRIDFSIPPLDPTMLFKLFFCRFFFFRFLYLFFLFSRSALWTAESRFMGALTSNPRSFFPRSTCQSLSVFGTDS